MWHYGGKRSYHRGGGGGGSPPGKRVLDNSKKTKLKELSRGQAFKLKCGSKGRQEKHLKYGTERQGGITLPQDRKKTKKKKKTSWPDGEKQLIKLSERGGTRVGGW